MSFAGSITPGVDLGALLVTTSLFANGSPLQTVQVPITSNPMTVSLPTEVYSAAVHGHRGSEQYRYPSAQWPIDVGFSATVTVSDPLEATVPATVSFAPGQNGAVFNVQSIAPRSTPTTVTVTYTVNAPKRWTSHDDSSADTHSESVVVQASTRGMPIAPMETP